MSCKFYLDYPGDRSNSNHTGCRVHGCYALALERHVEKPHDSEILQKYPSFLKNHHAVDLLADTLKIVILGGIGIYDLSDLMDLD